jgi:hypothetical protein
MQLGEAKIMKVDVSYMTNQKTKEQKRYAQLWTEIELPKLLTEVKP